MIMNSPTRRRLATALVLSAILVGAAPASASFPGKPGLLSYSSSQGYRDGTTSIRVQSPFGGPPRELLPHMDSAERRDVESTSDAEAAWSPSGNRFVFARRVGGGNLRLFVTEAGFTRAREIPLPETMFVRSPAFAPDGRTIVFVEVISGGDPSEEVTWEAGWNLWTVRTDGSGLRRLGPGDSPAWSPAGGLIAFLDSCGSLKVMRSDGSRVRTLVVGKEGNVCHSVGRPEFAPGGRKLAYSDVRRSGRSRVWEIFTIGVDGRGRRRITTTPGTGAGEPAWSPDGVSIAFHRAGKGVADSGIYRVPAGGGRQRRIAGTYVSDLAWQPRP